MPDTTQSLYWYDYETFGRHPALDRPSQFAGMRTTLDLKPLGNPLVIYNRLTDDYLPEPDACLVNRISPQQVEREGLIERAFIDSIHQELSMPGTCQVGYNNIRFDDEFTRFTLFRNFFDPYEHEWKNGNSRWDLIDVVRLTRALRPAGINWPTHPDGSSSNKLEDIASANDITHVNAHDALSDVEATIAVAAMIKQAQPKLYDYAFSHRDKASVASMLNTREQQAVCHVSGMVSGEYGHTAIVAPLLQHPINRNGIVVLDLRHDPEELAALDPDAIRDRIFKPQQALLPGESRLAIKTIHINKAPVVVPLSTLDDQSAERLGIDKAKSLKHLKTLKGLNGVAEKVGMALTDNRLPPPHDVDATLYSGGFFSPEQRRIFSKIRDSDAQTLSGMADCFNGEDRARCNEMLFRYRARNFPDSLNETERELWLEHCRTRLLETGEDLHSAETDTDKRSQLDRFNARLDGEWPEDQLALKTDLANWARLLKDKLTG